MGSSNNIVPDWMFAGWMRCIVIYERSFQQNPINHELNNERRRKKNATFLLDEFHSFNLTNESIYVWTQREEKKTKNEIDEKKNSQMRLNRSSKRHADNKHTFFFLLKKYDEQRDSKTIYSFWTYVCVCETVLVVEIFGTTMRIHRQERKRDVFCWEWKWKSVKCPKTITEYWKICVKFKLNMDSDSWFIWSICGEKSQSKIFCCFFFNGQGVNSSQLMMKSTRNNRRKKKMMASAFESAKGQFSCHLPVESFGLNFRINVQLLAINKWPKAITFRFRKLN